MAGFSSYNSDSGEGGYASTQSSQTMQYNPRDTQGIANNNANSSSWFSKYWWIILVALALIVVLVIATSSERKQQQAHDFIDDINQETINAHRDRLSTSQENAGVNIEVEPEHWQSLAIDQDPTDLANLLSADSSVYTQRLQDLTSQTAIAVEDGMYQFLNWASAVYNKDGAFISIDALKLVMEYFLRFQTSLNSVTVVIADKIAQAMDSAVGAVHTTCVEINYDIQISEDHFSDVTTNVVTMDRQRLFGCSRVSNNNYMRDISYQSQQVQLTPICGSYQIDQASAVFANQTYLSALTTQYSLFTSTMRSQSLNAIAFASLAAMSHN